MTSREGMCATGEHLKGWPAQSRGGSSVRGPTFKVFAPASGEAAWFLSSRATGPRRANALWPGEGSLSRPGRACPIGARRHNVEMLRAPEAYGVPRFHGRAAQKLAARFRRRQGDSPGSRPKAFVASAGTFYVPALQAEVASKATGQCQTRLATVTPAPQRRRLIQRRPAACRFWLPFPLKAVGNSA